MRIKDHIAKISWTFADKALYALYGFVVRLAQIAVLATPDEYGLYTHLEVMHMFIFSISDNFTLKAMIKFGTDGTSQRQINLIALILHTLLTMGLALVVFAAREPLATFFDEPRIGAVFALLPFYVFLTIPRTFCYKILFRDFRMKDVFYTDLIWFASLSLVSVYMISHGLLTTFEDMALISFIGMGISSLVLMFQLRRDLVFALRGPLNLHEVARFCRDQGSAGIIAKFVQFADGLIVQKFFSTHTVGVYQSAKTLFRLFETTLDSLRALAYPAAVRLISTRRIPELHALMSKSVSLYLMTMLAVVIVLEVGGADLLFTWFLPVEYAPAAAFLKLMLVACLAHPLILFYSAGIAFGDTHYALRNMALSGAAGILVAMAIGYSGISTLIPLGVIVYYYVLGFGSYFSTKQRLNLQARDLLRSWPDSINFVREYLKKFRA